MRCSRWLREERNSSGGSGSSSSSDDGSATGSRHMRTGLYCNNICMKCLVLRSTSLPSFPRTLGVAHQHKHKRLHRHGGVDLQGAQKGGTHIF